MRGAAMCIGLPDERSVSSVWLGTGPPLEAFSPPGNCANGIAFSA